MPAKDYKPQHSYQDDFDETPDPVMNELPGDPTEILGVSPKEFAKELNKLDDDDHERIESLDEDPEQQSLAA